MVGLGVERNVLWGSDYPHFDCTYPGVLKEVRQRDRRATRGHAAQHPDRQRDPILQLVVKDLA